MLNLGSFIVLEVRKFVYIKERLITPLDKTHIISNPSEF